MQGAPESKKSFKDTLNLPQTDFPIRANSKIDDPALIERWSAEDLFKKSFDAHAGREKYILHDGPPYANGNIHLGHAYNKILKDIITKAYRMAGYHVPVTPGWDCHGLPIEKGVTLENPNLDRMELIKACRLYATHWIEVQKQQFKNLGVLMDWDNPYVTMSESYEAAITRAFGVFVEHGFIERKNKTISWCYVDQTVLAAAEIEYKDRKDPSVYVLFPLKKQDQQRLFPDLVGTINILVWTTTPWTLPLNRAVLLHPETEYVLLDIKGVLCIVGAKVAAAISKMMEIEEIVLREFQAELLVGAQVQNPLFERYSPILLDESVGVTEGTATVHNAPGCGPIDYEIAVKNGLEIYSPINPDGTYSSKIEPQELAGMKVTDGQIWVIKKLALLGSLLYKTSITHSYPHCWRCHNGLIFRATPQWFLDLHRHRLKEKALQAIESIEFIPQRSRNFLKATLENRWEWCLSRQRTWGAPIPALICKTCDYGFTSQEFIEKISKGIEREGIEYWAHASLSDIMPAGLECPNCHTANFEKETDIIDVWFESGVSHYAVLYGNTKLGYPADIYLEGVDQHRAWFQSSLLTSLVLEEQACMKLIMSHGYTVDAKGQKMSKSLGNVVAPADIIEKIGTDGLRLWVASVGHDSDPSVSDVLLQNVQEVYRKVRNTCRFLLSNLYDYDNERDRVAANDLLPLDHFALFTLYKLNEEIQRDYLKADFTAVFHKLAQYCSTDLSAFYLDIIKDRLYVEAPSGKLRRSAQTVCFQILDTLTRLMAPIMSFTAELLSDHAQKDKKESIHLQFFTDVQTLRRAVFEYAPLWPALDPLARPSVLDTLDVTEQENLELRYTNQWQALADVRSVILKAIEEKREQGMIKHSLEARVRLFIDVSKDAHKPIAQLFDALKKQGYDLEQFLKEYCIVSQFSLAHNAQELVASQAEGVFLEVAHARGTKCPRCWNWDETNDPDGLNARCQKVLGRTS